jgi:hypothetical protein
MQMDKMMEIIRKDSSRVRSYVVMGEVGTGKSSCFREKNKEYSYLDFNDEAEHFFEKTKMSLRVFDIGEFFKYIEEAVGLESGITVIDNLEVIQNILYNQDREGRYLERFFNVMCRQGYRGKVVYVLSDIRKMMMEKHLEKSKLPKNNIIRWGNL